MSPVSALVLFAVIWFLVLFVVLPIRMQTQGDVGEKVDGTPAGAPADGFSMRRKLRLITLVSILIWAAISAVIIWGEISVRDIDFFNRMPPSASSPNS